METSLAFRAWFIVSDVSIITLQPNEMLHDDDHYKPNPEWSKLILQTFFSL